MTEYLLIFAGVVLVLVIALAPGGVVTQKLNQSLDTALESFDQSINQPCLSGADKTDGKWTNWGIWQGCAWDVAASTCQEYSTRTCTNPAPKCGGAKCLDVNGNPDADDVEMRFQSCWSGSDYWETTCPCGAGVCSSSDCKGTCGDTTGTQNCIVSCVDGPDTDDKACCNPAGEPAAIQPCIKARYPGTWGAPVWGPCNVSCGSGQQIAISIPCSDSSNCCDPNIIPASTQNCTNGCCAATLDIGSGFTGDFPYTADWTTATATTPCPIGYAGTPQRDCLAGAWATSLVSGTGCVPANCTDTQADATQNVCDTSKAPGCSLTAAFPDTVHDAWGTVDCTNPTYKQGNGAGYTGSATMRCRYGDWEESTLTAQCIPNCPADPQNIGLGLIGPFPETPDPGGSGVVVSYDCTIPPYTQGSSCGQTRYAGIVSRTCNAGTWSALSGSCSYQSCAQETFCDPAGTGICGTFGDTASVPHGTPDTVTCTDVDARYTGSFTSTCDYGEWCNGGNPGVTGGCSAKSCLAWTTTVIANDNVGVAVTFDATGHGFTKDGTETDMWHTCNVQSKCCFGIWVDPVTDCASVAAGTPNGYSQDCSCWLNQCTGDPGLSSTIATVCAGDTEWLDQDTAWVVVNNGGCTSRKCEYECNVGYYKSGNNCVAFACTPSANPDPNNYATLCTGDGTGLLADTPKTLVASCSFPTGSPPKCEYRCPSGYPIYNGRCCYPSCGSLCGTQTLCGVSVNCGSCCGNGAINAGEVCDGTNLNGQTCAGLGYTGTGSPPGCNATCTAYTQNNCCNKVEGTWTGGWANIGGCGAYQTCKQLQRQTCAGNSCGGSCTGIGPAPEQYEGCYGGGSCCSSTGTCADSDPCTIDTCDTPTWTCSYTPKSCPDNGNWCDGVEYCNDAGNCVSEGNPCAYYPNQTCYESIDQCCCYTDMYGTCKGYTTYGTCSGVKEYNTAYSGLCNGSYGGSCSVSSCWPIGSTCESQNSDYWGWICDVYRCGDGLPGLP